MPIARSFWSAILVRSAVTRITQVSSNGEPIVCPAAPTPVVEGQPVNETLSTRPPFERRAVTQHLVSFGATWVGCRVCFLPLLMYSPLQYSATAHPRI
jgi:hypothetical protein